LVFAVGVNAQVQSETTESAGQATHQVQVEHGTVIMVDGNDLFIRMEDGSLRHIPNVPDSARVDVNGKEVGIHDLKPGMKLQRTITTTTTPKTITTVQTVTGKVWHVQPPSRLILSLADGTNQSFTIPKGQKFNIDGNMVDAWGLKKGMNVSATKVVESPVTVVEQQKKLTGQMPPPPPPPPDVPVLVVFVPHPAAPTAQAPAEQAATTLPKTGSSLPLIGLVGLLCVGLSLGLRKLHLS
jgi:LPXTG-motif cell wall-anchored protein